HFEDVPGAVGAIGHDLPKDEAEHGNLRLVEGWGSGTRGDPYVVVEEIYGDGPAILTIRDPASRQGQAGRLGSAGLGFVLRKIVTNRTNRAWNVFEMELREWLELHSGYFDGLSFGQAKQRSDATGSDRYTDVEVFDEPTDRIAFVGATVAPGETVTLQITVTDHSPKSEFYLLQRRDAPMAALEGP
ncbi:MAG: hypothetical protein AAFX81_21355, partial [Pseudomonadota bacterium]